MLSASAAVSSNGWRITAGTPKKVRSAAGMIEGTWIVAEHAQSGREDLDLSDPSESLCCEAGGRDAFQDREGA